MPFRRENRHVTLSLIIIVASLLVVGIGVQALLAQQDNADRDRRDRAYADCLTDFASNLVDTIERRTEAGIRLDEAEEMKSRALDRLLRITELARRTPPEATSAAFDRALDARVAAQQHYLAVKREVDAVRDSNEYVSPEAACPR